MADLELPLISNVTSPLDFCLMNISLQEITADTVRDVTNLSVREDQKQFVASNAESLAEALFSPEAWYRAIHADNELAGFVMLHDESLRSTPPQEPRVGVWHIVSAPAGPRLATRCSRSIRLACSGHYGFEKFEALKGLDMNVRTQVAFQARQWHGRIPTSNSY